MQAMTASLLMDASARPFIFTATPIMTLYDSLALLANTTVLPRGTPQSAASQYKAALNEMCEESSSKFTSVLPQPANLAYYAPVQEELPSYLNAATTSTDFPFGQDLSSKKVSKSQDPEPLEGVEGSYDQSKRGYTVLTDGIRQKLVNLVRNEHLSIKEASRRLSLNYSTAKTILTVFKKEGRISKKRKISDKIVYHNRGNKGSRIMKKMGSISKECSCEASTDSEQMMM